MKIEVQIYFNLIIFFLLSAACGNDRPKDHKNLQFTTEEQKRIYYQDSIAFGLGNGITNSRPSFAHFFRDNYAYLDTTSKYDEYSSAVLYALEEEFITSKEIETKRNWIRFTVNPCFRHPYCLVLEKKFNRTYLTAKATNGDGGYFAGILDFQLTKVFPDTLYDNISNKINQMDFWNLSKDTTCLDGYDGERWVIEAIENGKYNVIDRWVPIYCGDTITNRLGSIGIELSELMEFKIEKLHNRRFSLSMEELFKLSKGKYD